MRIWRNRGGQALATLISGGGRLFLQPPENEAAMAQRRSKAREAANSSKAATEYWSGDVTRHSDALDLESGVFTWDDPARIARSLKRSAERSERRKSAPFRSAMSMLTFYINRAGKDLSDDRRKVLERAKDELRKAFGRAPAD
jgi:hypothetical protein